LRRGAARTPDLFSYIAPTASVSPIVSVIRAGPGRCSPRLSAVVAEVSTARPLWPRVRNSSCGCRLQIKFGAFKITSSILTAGFQNNKIFFDNKNEKYDFCHFDNK
jgi:hypothetical protein